MRIARKHSHTGLQTPRSTAEADGQRDGYSLSVTDSHWLDNETTPKFSIYAFKSEMSY